MKNIPLFVSSLPRIDHFFTSATNESAGVGLSTVASQTATKSPSGRRCAAAADNYSIQHVKLYRYR